LGRIFTGEGGGGGRGNLSFRKGFFFPREQAGQFKGPGPKFFLVQVQGLFGRSFLQFQFFFWKIHFRGEGGGGGGGLAAARGISGFFPARGPVLRNFSIRGDRRKKHPLGKFFFSRRGPSPPGAGGGNKAFSLGRAKNGFFFGEVFRRGGHFFPNFFGAASIVLGGGGPPREKFSLEISIFRGFSRMGNSGKKRGGGGPEFGWGSFFSIRGASHGEHWLVGEGFFSD